MRESIVCQSVNCKCIFWILTCSPNTIAILPLELFCLANTNCVSHTHIFTFWVWISLRRNAVGYNMESKNYVRVGCTWFQKGGGREGVNPSDVSSISGSAPGDVLRKSVNPWIGFDHQQRAGHSCMFLQPWQPKEPWLNVYKEKVPGVLHFTITLHPSS